MSKRALAVVDQIEDRAAELQWTPGVMLGDEAQLMREFYAGRSVLRQGIRLAEHLGIASMRRGRSGGLVISEPLTLPASLSLRISWAQLKLVPRATERLYKTVDQWGQTAPPGSDLITKIVTEAFNRYSLPIDSLWEPHEDKLGAQVAGKILSSILGPESKPDLIGSEANLMATYGVGRAAVREAVHLLELHGAATMQRGPGGGLITMRQPSPGAITRSARAQLRSKGFSPDEIAELMKHLLNNLPSEDVLPAGVSLKLAAQAILDDTLSHPAGGQVEDTALLDLSEPTSPDQ